MYLSLRTGPLLIQDVGKHIDMNTPMIIAQGSAHPECNSHLLQPSLKLLELIYSQSLLIYPFDGYTRKKWNLCIALELLSTCRTIYVQAHTLPLYKLNKSPWGRAQRGSSVLSQPLEDLGQS